MSLPCWIARTKRALNAKLLGWSFRGLGSFSDASKEEVSCRSSVYFLLLCLSSPAFLWRNRVQRHSRSAGATLTLLPCSLRRRKQGLAYAYVEKFLSPPSRGVVCRPALYWSRGACVRFGSGRR